MLSLWRDRQVDGLAYLAEEIEAMGRSERQAVKSNLRIILMHLLKYHYQPQRRSKSWLTTLVEHRQRVQDAFENSPSLRRYRTRQRERWAR